VHVRIARAGVACTSPGMMQERWCGDAGDHVGREGTALSVSAPGGAAPAGGPTVLRMLLGAQLRRLRDAAGITRDDAGYHIRASGSKISRMELGRVSFKERDVTDLLEYYGVTDLAEREKLVQLTREANATPWYQKFQDVVPDWFHVYVGLEEAAQLIRVYEVQFVPGLLQTEEYARAVVVQGSPGVDPDEVERRVALRMGRQKLLTRENPPRYWVIMDEAALRRPMGGRDVHVAQIERLIDLVGEPNITLQVMPFRYGGHAADGGAFTIMRFPETDLPDVVYMEYLTGAHYIDKPEEVERYAAVMERLSVAGTSPDRTREILAAMLKDI
jgi:transcriptional regulator with XRE-family HTH domain